MEKDRYLPMKGIPKAELKIDSRTLLPLAVKPDGRVDLAFEENPVLSGGQRIDIKQNDQLKLYIVEPDETERPIGY